MVKHAIEKYLKDVQYNCTLVIVQCNRSKNREYEFDESTILLEIPGQISYEFKNNTFNIKWKSDDTNFINKDGKIILNWETLNLKDDLEEVVLFLYQRALIDDKIVFLHPNNDRPFKMKKGYSINIT